MAVIASRSSSRDARMTRPLRGCPSAWDGANWAAIEEGDHVFYDLRVGAPVVLLRDITDMRRQDHVRCCAQRMIDRQRLFVVDVEPGIGETPSLQRGDDRFGVADRPARR